MINDESKRKLRELNMPELIDALEIQQLEPATLKLKFDDRMQRAIDYALITHPTQFHSKNILNNSSSILHLPNKIVVLSFFVKDICYDLIPFGFSCPNRLDCLS